ncbi:quinol:cytochrome C oxidoreductase [Polaribacter reichenbachii]|uniref:Quinol:cytochrome C oxidoreductase n=1 Tax=Polaribacter reichenbachii TaxID=996801 RepID=A0A1B8TVN6_9FLAO|nr:TAT-variant-translocated molybdopterin oxidoreductase [Polaribacter reichenbachii]APZ45445.1 quinol:cytochrome C oxidoreductase [Polaribacter reichenbachii]AUC19306.1 quinol:cytochrome C oxidoreductase [Polaribacter reichenbachii]OBY63539.1 quinol:cytochrome C oxidoreductase [Polaribacter reichenbachii]
MASNKKYWKSVEELKDSSIVETLSKNEFVEEIPTDQFLGDKETLENSSTSRRDFLKYVGFTTAAASLAACEGPVRKSIPYVVRPNDIIAGVADWYATSIADGYDFANVLVKTREGRPIQIMPNKDANGTTSARVQASVLSLYDEKLRLKEPTKAGEVISWADADKEIAQKLNSLKEAGKPVVLLTGTMASPSTDKIVSEFIAANPNVKHVVYDAVSESGAADAMLAMYGKRVLPNYHLDKAKTIVSFGADFLGDFHGGFEKSFMQGRDPKTGHMSYHVQFESNMSLTGANSDKRVVLKPSDQVFALLNLYSAITGNAVSSKSTPVDAEVKRMAAELKKAGSKAVVLTGLNDKNAQLVAFAINEALNSEIFDTKNTLNIRQGNDVEVAQLVSDMKSGKVAGLISYNVDPVYTLPNASAFADGLKKLELSVALSTENTATADISNFALPAPHFLESWGDTQFNAVTYGLMQPTIQPLFNTRQFQDTLLKWSGSATKYYDYLKTYAADNVLGGSSWNTALHNGFFTTELVAEESTFETTVSVADAANQLASSAKKATGFELNLYTKTGLGDGKQANNPWLQEFPDPITRASWDNYLTISIADAKELEFENPVKDNGAIDGDFAKVTVNGVEVTVPVMIQPGQAKGSVGLALGYGKTFGLKEEMQVGVNAYPLYNGGNNIQYNVKIEKVSGTHKFACTQVQKTIAGRHDILKVASLKEYNTVAPKDHHHGWNKPSMVSYDHQEVEANTIDLWDEHNREVGHHFNLSIDLTSCTGCGACVVACHAENNVPVVGKNEVRVGRDMHWLRIDRYYSSEVETREDAKELGLSRGDTYRALETEAENPEVTFQPMMCQHCNHAPCETVCPVAATSHGRQGQNQMAYNRCVGTRYCANNCPYRVRRFNWFNYANNNEFDFNMNNEYGKMVLNPDVVVRSRGVMEKCSMCIQMTQATILKAKKEGRPVNTDEFETACSSACTTGAMVFGDVNNKEDQVAALAEDKRAYNVLDYLQTKPNVIYQVKIKNTNEA